MIHYQLHCGQGHEFDGWFANSSAFDDQHKRGLIACPHCADINVQRALMAPAIGRKSNRTAKTLLQTDVPVATELPATKASTALTLPDTEAVTQIAALVQQMRSEIETHCDYVGTDFAEEARKIHYGETDARGIYGEATMHEAQELVDEGIEVAALPWVSRTHS